MRIENTLKSSQSDAVSELQPLYEKKRVQERPDIWIARGQNNILDRIKETLGRTRRELLVAMPVVPDSVISMATPLLSLMNSRGGKVSVMIPSTISKEVTRKLTGL